MNKWLISLSLLSGVVLCSCGSTNNENVNPNTDVNAIVVYFSATGITEEVANMIGTYLDSPVYELL